MSKKGMVILGNGFDVASGFNTRYRDFYESYRIKLADAANNGNELCKSILEDDGDKELWADLETGLYNYSCSLTAKYGEGNKEVANKFYADFNELRSLLHDYLNNEFQKSVESSSGSFIRVLVDQWERLTPLIFTFNYTPISFLNNHNAYAIFDEARRGGPNRIIFQHGAIVDVVSGNHYKPEELVLGIDPDAQKVESAHSFLYKSVQKSHNVSQFVNAIEMSDVIIIFGCSMGSSDEWYFRQVFNPLISGKHYILYGRNEEDRQNLFGRINALCSSLNDFRIRNSIDFIITTPPNNPITETGDLLNRFQ